MKDINGIPVLKHMKQTIRQYKTPKSLILVVLDERTLYRRQNGKCFYCQTEMFPAPHSLKYPQGWTRDHFFPKSYGNDLAANLVLACQACNSGKSDDAPTLKEVKKFKQLYAGQNLVCMFGKGASL